MDGGKKVIVVGGGAAGLGATYTLRQRGINVTMLEASDHAGGRMAGEVVNGFHIDTGAQFFSTAYKVAIGIADELGIPFDRSPVEATLGVYNKRKDKFGALNLSRIVSLTNLKTLLSSGLFSPRGHWQMLKFARMLARRRDDFSSNDNMRILDLDFEGNLADFVKREIGQTFLEEFCEYPVAVNTLSAPERLSPLHGLMLLGLGLLERRYKIHNPDQGIGFFSQALAQACADDTRLSTPVEQVVIEDGAAAGVIANGGFIKADAVICATTAPAALQIVSGFPEETRTFLSKVAYSSCCHVVFGVDGHPLPEGQYLFAFQRKGDSFLDCWLDSAVGSPLSAPPGKGIIHAFVSDEHSEEMMALGDDEIGKRVIGEIRRYTPAMPTEPIFTRVYRWENAVCLPYGGMMRDLQALRERGFPGVKGLFLAGEYMVGLPSMNGALAAGVTAAEDAQHFLAHG